MKGLVGAVAVAACLAAPVAVGGSDQWGLSGSGVGSGALTGDHVMIGAHSDADGTNVRGAAENQGTIAGTDITVNVGGRVVCLRVADHRAVAVWQLREPIVVPSTGRVYAYGAAYVEDNGEPQDGQPVDRMVDYVVREVNVHFFCEADPTAFFGAADAAPLQSGNFVVRGG